MNNKNSAYSPAQIQFNISKADIVNENNCYNVQNVLIKLLVNQNRFTVRTGFDFKFSLTTVKRLSIYQQIL